MAKKVKVEKEEAPVVKPEPPAAPLPDLVKASPPSMSGAPITPEVASAAAEVQSPANPPAQPSYRVLKDKTFSFYGQIVRWKAGSTHEMWSAALKHAQDAGVELELVK